MAEAQPTDAIELLKADHRTVEGLFEEFDKARRSDKKAKLVAQICDELKIHTLIEEEIFYPTIRPKIEADIVDEGFVEHDGAKLLINDLLRSTPGEQYYDAKVKVLSEEIKHHVHEEERWMRGMFAQARRTDVDMDALGAKMAARKAELKGQGGNQGPAARQAHRRVGRRLSRAGGRSPQGRPPANQSERHPSSGSSKARPSRPSSAHSTVASTRTPLRTTMAIEAAGGGASAVAVAVRSVRSSSETGILPSQVNRLAAIGRRGPTGGASPETVRVAASMTSSRRDRGTAIPRQLLTHG